MRKVLTMLLMTVMGTGLCQANMVSNPGFETGDLSDWFSGGSAVVISGENGPSVPGSYAAYLSNAPSPGDIRSRGILVSPGEELIFSVDYLTAENATGVVRAQVRWHQGVDLNGNAIGWVGESNYLLNSGGVWAVHTSNEVVPQNAGAVDIRISAGVFEAFVGDGLIDNVQLIPEPATLALLGLGGLLLRKRS